MDGNLLLAIQGHPDLPGAVGSMCNYFQALNHTPGVTWSHPESFRISNIKQLCRSPLESLSVSLVFGSCLSFVLIY